MNDRFGQARLPGLQGHDSVPLQPRPALRFARETAEIAPAWLWDSLPLRQAWARLDPATAVTILRADATLDTDHDLALPGTNVDRREFNGLAVGLLTSAALPHVPLQVPARVDAVHVRYLQTTVEQLRNHDQSRGGGAILRHALAQFTRARRMINESDYTDAIGRQLLAAASALGNEAGWATFDHGDQRLARSLYGEAQVLATSSGDIEMQTLLWANMSM